jgi:glycosyltransferase involved in cell wall biosynthesis
MFGIKKTKVAVVIACYRVKRQIMGVLSGIGKEVDRIYIIDDKCPEKSGAYVQQKCRDKRVKVLYNEKNLGVGGAVIRGYQQALRDQMDVVVKVDGDGQMNPALIPKFIAPIVSGQADFTKGNRFFALDTLHKMPSLRLFGNTVLSFISKISSGYWDIMDPTNGFTAIHCKIIEHLPLARLAKRYFFESDMLFRLNILRAVVMDIPMKATYGDERSSLSIVRTVFTFPWKYLIRLFKRLFYNYFLRDFNIGSFSFILAVVFLGFSLVFGVMNIKKYFALEKGAPAGTVMTAALPVILGVQFLLAAISYDINSVPKDVLHIKL